MNKNIFTIIFPKDWEGKKKTFHHIPEKNMLEIACEEESCAESHDAIWLEAKGVKHAIMYGNIVCIRAFKGGCQVFTDDHTYELGVSLKKVFTQLDARLFMFVHRNCIVRIEAVEEYSYHLLKMQDKQVVQIGKKYLTICHAVWGKDGK